MVITCPTCIRRHIQHSVGYASVIFITVKALHPGQRVGSERTAVLLRGVLEIGPDQATVKITAALWWRPNAKQREPFANKGWNRDMAGSIKGFRDRQSGSGNPATNEKRSHLLLWGRTPFMAKAQLSLQHPCKYGLCWSMFSFLFFFYFLIDEARSDCQADC